MLRAGREYGLWEIWSSYQSRPEEEKRADWSFESHPFGLRISAAQPGLSCSWHTSLGRVSMRSVHHSDPIFISLSVIVNREVSRDALSKFFISLCTLSIPSISYHISYQSAFFIGGEVTRIYTQNINWANLPYTARWLPSLPTHQWTLWRQDSCVFRYYGVKILVVH